MGSWLCRCLARCIHKDAALADFVLLVTLTHDALQFSFHQETKSRGRCPWRWCRRRGGFVARLFCDLCGSAGSLVVKVIGAMLSALVRCPSQMRGSIYVNGLRTAISVTGIAKPCRLPREIV